MDDIGDSRLRSLREPSKLLRPRESIARDFREWRKSALAAENGMSLKSRMISRAAAGADFREVKIPRGQKEFSKKQLKFIRAKHARINILSGAVRSGKTYISLFYWVLYVASRPAGYEYLMVGRTLTSLMRNCFGCLSEFLGDNFKYSVSNKRAEIAGRVVWLEGANDARSEGKIRGTTLAGAYIDESTLVPQDFFAMLLTRLSVPGARLYATTNPDAQTHWLKTDYIDNVKLDKALFEFTIDDNPYLPKEYVADLKKSFWGAFYDRFILGLWVAASGKIYDMFDDGNIYTDENRPKGLKYVAARRIAVDYGTQNPCTFLDIYDDGVTLWVDNQYWWDGKKEQRQKTDAHYVTDMKAFIGKDPAQITCDPSAASFIAALKQSGIYVKAADNEVIGGIRAVGTLIAQRNIRVHRDRCRNLIREIQSYAWDDKALKKGAEAPIKTDDHGCDALRYDVNTNVQKWRKGVAQ
jgi:PBSX family phage terminase large subunit